MVAFVEEPFLPFCGLIQSAGCFKWLIISGLIFQLTHGHNIQPRFKMEAAEARV